MIELIYGAKGSGKTTRIIEKANECAENAKGNVVFVSPQDKYSLAISNKIKFVVTNEYSVTTSDQLVSFIKGMVAGNADICNVFIDGIARIGSVDPVEVIPMLDKLSADHKVDFTLTLSMAEVPASLKRYI